MINFTKEMPTTGQFVAVWEHDDKVWSHTLKWDNDNLFFYDTYTGSFRTDNRNIMPNEHYIVIEGS